MIGFLFGFSVGYTLCVLLAKQPRKKNGQFTKKHWWQA